MDDIRMDVAESQMDKLAGRVAELERMLGCLVKTLEAPAIADRIGLTDAHVARIRNTFLTVQHAEIRHYNERAGAVASAERSGSSTGFDRNPDSRIRKSAAGWWKSSPARPQSAKDLVQYSGRGLGPETPLQQHQGGEPDDTDHFAVAAPE